MVSSGMGREEIDTDQEQSGAHDDSGPGVPLDGFFEDRCEPGMGDRVAGDSFIVELVQPGTFV